LSHAVHVEYLFAIVEIEKMDGVLSRLSNEVRYGVLYLGNYSILKLISPRPDYVEVRVTEGCNSRCITCGAWKNSREGELSTEEMIDAFKQLREIGVKSIRISGGEPLIRSDIVELIKECRLLKFQDVYVATNGLLLPQKGEELVKGGVTHFGVSLDGIGETNDVIRGVTGGYERVLEGINVLKRSMKKVGIDIPITVFTTLLRQNVREVPLLLKLCEDIGVSWCFSLLDGNLDFFEGIDISDLVIKDWKVIDETIDYLKKLWNEKPRLVYSGPQILEYARNYLKGIERDDDLPCTLGYKLISLGSRGEVYAGCYVFEPIGSIRETRLSNIVKSKEYKALAEKMYRRECSSCTFFYEDNVLIRHMFPKAERIRSLVRSK
jgi:MoaA/NifB/PqqE/SkfB family radical SAM enzyme